MQKTRDRPKQKKAKKPFSLKKSFENLKQKLKNLKPKKAKAPKKQKPKAKKVSLKESFNSFKAKMKNAFKVKPKKQNPSKPGKVDFAKAISGVFVILALVAIIGIFGNIGGTKTVIKNENPTISDNDSLDTDINGVIRQYKVNAGASVNAGDFVEFVNKYGSGEFYAGAVSYLSACKLDNNRVFVAFRCYSDSSYHLKCVTLTIDGNEVTVGNETVVSSSNNSNSYTCISVAPLTSNKVFLSYKYYGATYGTWHINSSVLTIEESNITVGTPNVLNADVHGMSVVALTDSKVLLAYGTNSSVQKGLAMIFTIDGTDITPGTLYAFGDNYMNVVNAIALTENKVVVAYRGSNSSFSTFMLLTVSGYSITAGQNINVVYDITFTSLVKLSDSKVLCVFCDDNQEAIAQLYSVGDGTIGRLAHLEFNDTSTAYTSAVALNENKVLVVYKDGNNSAYGTAKVLNIEDTTITDGEAYVFDYNALSYNSLVAFSETSALVVYYNGLSLYSNLSIDGISITADSANQGTFVQPATSNLHNVGIAKTSGKEGDIIEVYCAK